MCWFWGPLSCSKTIFLSRQSLKYEISSLKFLKILLKNSIAESKLYYIITLPKVFNKVLDNDFFFLIKLASVLVDDTL